MNTITICFGDRYRCIARPASYRALQREGRKAFPDMSAVYSIVVLFQVPELPDRWVELGPDAYAVVRGGAVLYFNVQHPITKQYILPLPDQDPDTVVPAPQTSNNGAHLHEESGTLNRASDTAGEKQLRPPTSITRPPAGPYNTFSKGIRSTTSAFTDLRGGGDVCGSGWGAASQRLRQSARLVPSRKECQEGWGLAEGASVGYPDEGTANDDEERARKNPKQGVACQQRDNCLNKCSYHCSCTLCLQRRADIIPTPAFTTVRPFPGGGRDNGWAEGPRDGVYMYGKTPVPGSSVSNRHIGNTWKSGGPSQCGSVGFRYHQKMQRAAALWDSDARPVQRGVGRMSLAPSATDNGWVAFNGRGGLGQFTWRQASACNDRCPGRSRGDNQDFSVSCSGPAAHVQCPPPGFSREHSIYQSGYEDGNEGYHHHPYQAEPQHQQPYSCDVEHDTRQSYGGWGPVWPYDCEIPLQKNDAHGCQYQHLNDQRVHPTGSLTMKEAHNLDSVWTSSNIPPCSIVRPANHPPPPSSSSHFHPAKYATGSPRKSRTKARLSSAWAAGRKRRAGRMAADTWDDEQQFRQVYHEHLKQDQPEGGHGGMGDHHPFRGNVGSTTDHHATPEYHSAATEDLEEAYHDAPERADGDENTEYYHHAGEYNTSRSARQGTSSDPVQDENFGENSGENSSAYDGQGFPFHLLAEEDGGDDEHTEADAAPAPSHIPRARWPGYWSASPPPTQYEALATTALAAAPKTSKYGGRKDIAATEDGGQESDVKRKKHGKKSTEQSGIKQSGMKNVTRQWQPQETNTMLKKLRDKEQTAPAAAAGASNSSCTYQHQCLCDRCTYERCCVHYIRTQTDEKQDWGEKLGGHGWCACTKGCPEHNHLRFW